MRDYKKDVIWGIVLTALSVIPMILGMIPGITMMESVDETGVIFARNLFRLDEWNNGGVTGALITLSHIYTIILSAFYIRNQSPGLAKAIFLGAIVAVVVGVAALLTEQQLQPVPFFVIPLIDCVTLVLAIIRIRYEENWNGVY